MIHKYDTASTLPNTQESEQTWRGRKILQSLFAAIKAATVYEANNQAYRSRVEEFGTRLNEYIQRYGSLRIDYYNDFLFIDGFRIKYGSTDFSHDRVLATMMEELQLGRLEFTKALTEDQIDRTIFALAHIDRRVDNPFETLHRTWLELQLNQMTIKRMAPKIANRLSTDQELLNSAQLRHCRAGSLFSRATDLVGEFTRRINNTKTFNSAKAQRVVHDLVDHIVKDEASLLEFASIKDFDDYTYTHSTNVCIYSISLGLRLGLDRRRLSRLGFAALFHDVGKVKLPAELINKPDEYNDDDWQIMHQHPILGALTLGAMPNTEEHHARAMMVAYEHHQSLDGGGYPRSRTPGAVNLFSRIVAIADSYDAMTSGRVYMKGRMSPDEALRRLLYQNKTRYDPILLRAFTHVLGVFPVGTFVHLNTGEFGVVSTNDPEDLYRPNIRILREADGTTIDGHEIKLTATDPQTGNHMAYIEQIIDPDEAQMSVREALGIKAIDDEMPWV